jgi:glycosyltransferase involved in cell wall biosynthesis
MEKKLSAVILTKNEEGKIKNCLESITWVDEIVIVDGFSTDKTVEICKQYNAKIIQHAFEGDFGQERNIGIDNASGDWVLQLDADDVVTQGFRQVARKILEEEGEFVAYKFLRKNFFMGHFMRYGGWYHYSLHFFKKGFARYQGKVHHDLIVNGTIGVLNEEIEHYPFDNFSQFIERQNRYTNLEAKEIVDLERYINEKNISYNIRIKPVKLFWKFYVKKKGFKEGMHGFIFSVLFAWVHFLKWVKVWEKLYSQPQATGYRPQAD